MLSERIKNIESSGIRKIFELAANNKGDFVDLSIGQPHYSANKNLKINACRGVQENNNLYSSTQGILSLRQEIAGKLKKQNNINANPEDIIITSGVSAGIFLAFSSIINRNDEVILPDPCFVLYRQIIKFLGGKPVFLDTYPNFHINPDNLEKLITKKTKAVVINSPSNPTGMVYGKEEIAQIVKVANKHKLLIVSDEVYENFDYEKKFFSPASIYFNTITLNGFSKSHFITGWRLGYAHGPKKIIQAMNKLQQYTFVCAPTPLQHALVGCIEKESNKKVEEYKKNRALLYSKLKNFYEFKITEGAFYAFIKIPKGQKDFINKVIKNKLLVVPGEVFSEKRGYFRISFAVPRQTLEKGIKILLKVLK